jgi:hypothetical protein
LHARLTATLSISVALVSSRWVSAPESPRTAITRHSGMRSPNRARYASATRLLTAFEVTDSR